MRELERRVKALFRDPYTGGVVNREVTVREILMNAQLFPPDLIAREIAPVVLALAEKLTAMTEPPAPQPQTLGQYDDSKQQAPCPECGWGNNGGHHRFTCSQGR